MMYYLQADRSAQIAVSEEPSDPLTVIRTTAQEINLKRIASVICSIYMNYFALQHCCIAQTAAQHRGSLEGESQSELDLAGGRGGAANLAGRRTQAARGTSKNGCGSPT